MPGKVIECIRAPRSRHYFTTRRIELYYKLFHAQHLLIYDRVKVRTTVTVSNLTLQPRNLQTAAKLFEPSNLESRTQLPVSYTHL